MLPSNGILAFIVISVLVVVPLWKIFGKAGFAPALSLLTVIPILNLVIMYYVAFSRWPSDSAH